MPNRQKLWEALVRNRYMPPPCKDRLNTVKFMRGVLNQEFFLLRQEQVEHVKQCADRPSREWLAPVVAEAMRSCPVKFGEPIDSAIRRTAEQIVKSKPDVQWQLTMLAQFQPEHDVFRKDYVHPRKKRQGLMADFYVNNPDNFFDGLPEVPVIGKKRGRGINFVDQAQKKRARVDRMEQQLSFFQRRLDEEKQQLGAEVRDSPRRERHVDGPLANLSVNAAVSFEQPQASDHLSSVDHQGNHGNQGRGGSLDAGGDDGNNIDGSSNGNDGNEGRVSGDGNVGGGGDQNGTDGVGLSGGIVHPNDYSFQSPQATAATTTGGEQSAFVDQPEDGGQQQVSSMIAQMQLHTSDDGNVIGNEESHAVDDEASQDTVTGRGRNKAKTTIPPSSQRTRRFYKQ